MSGVLRCSDCGHEIKVEDFESRFREGWERCCGQTMRLTAVKNGSIEEAVELAIDNQVAQRSGGRRRTDR